MSSMLYNDTTGQAFALKQTFKNYAALIEDEKKKFASPVGIGDYVLITYGEKSSDDYQTNRAADVGYGQFYNGKLYQKIYDPEANAPKYSPVCDFQGASPFINPSPTPTAGETPKVKLAEEQADSFSLAFRVPRAPYIARTTYEFVDLADENNENNEPSGTLSKSKFNGNNDTREVEVTLTEPTTFGITIVTPANNENEPPTTATVNREFNTGTKIIYTFTSPSIGKGQAKNGNDNITVVGENNTGTVTVDGENAYIPIDYCPYTPYDLHLVLPRSLNSVDLQLANRGTTKTAEIVNSANNSGSQLNLTLPILQTWASEVGLDYDNTVAAAQVTGGDTANPQLNLTLPKTEHFQATVGEILGPKQDPSVQIVNIDDDNSQPAIDKKQLTFNLPRAPQFVILTGLVNGANKPEGTENGDICIDSSTSKVYTVAGDVLTGGAQLQPYTIELVGEQIDYYQNSQSGNTAPNNPSISTSVSESNGNTTYTLRIPKPLDISAGTITPNSDDFALTLDKTGLSSAELNLRLPPLLRFCPLAIEIDIGNVSINNGAFNEGSILQYLDANKATLQISATESNGETTYTYLKDLDYSEIALIRIVHSTQVGNSDVFIKSTDATYWCFKNGENSFLLQSISDITSSIKKAYESGADDSSVYSARYVNSLIKSGTVSDSDNVTYSASYINHLNSVQVKDIIIEPQAINENLVYYDAWSQLTCGPTNTEIAPILQCIANEKEYGYLDYATATRGTGIEFHFHSRPTSNITIRAIDFLR